jgi:Flp pilus assembly pilin Flp
VRNEERGQGMTEYLIVVALIAIAAVAVFSRFGQTMRYQVAGIAGELVGVAPPKSSKSDSAQGKARKAAKAADIVKGMDNYGATADLGKAGAN